MKKIIVRSPHYRRYEKRFKLWLRIIGMGRTAQYYMPLHVREMLSFMEQREIIELELITPELLRIYVQQLSNRKNQRRGGGISKSYINKHLQAIKKFSEYIWKVYKIQISVSLKRQVINDGKKIEILTAEEISSLYEAAEYDDYLMLRDKALLDVFYGCGLRRTEGVMLDLEDVDLELRRIHVRYGKNYSQRYVPFTKTTAESLRAYIDHGRKYLLNQSNRAFFISQKGNRMRGMSMILRIKKLQERSNVASIKDKDVGLHTLRHSIATHFLQNGMELQQIQKFLGHSSLESTQIYTHLLEKQEP